MLHEDHHSNWHEVALDEHKSAAIVWCQQTIGEHNLDWYTNSYYRKFWFKNEKDAIMFTMKWV
jgi:hypothetical protein